jgi:type II secretory pathway pseudopilin PulG
MERRAFLKLSAGAALAAFLPGASGASRQAEQRRQFESFLRDMEARFRSMQMQPPFGPRPAPVPTPQSYTAPPATHDEYDFVLARVQFKEQGLPGQGKGPDVWNVRPGGDANLLRELAAVIRCHVKPVQAFDWDPQYAHDGQLNAIVTLNDFESLREYPFLFMTGENNYVFTDEQKQNLQDYLKAGGFLLMDDCVVSDGGDFFYRSSYELLENLFGKGSVRQIPREHEICHNIYDLREVGLPTLEYIRRRPYRMMRQTHGQNHGLRGLFLGDRLAVFLSSTDLHCGWCDSHGIEWGLDAYRKTIQWGINIILYAMTH